MTRKAGACKTALYALRGVSRECPENTIASIRAAICQGYDGVILDVQVTADGVPVLGRNTNVSDLPFAQVRRMDVGEAFAPRFRGETVPKLSDALTLAKNAGVKVCLNMDLVPRERERDVFALVPDGMFTFRDPQRVLGAAKAVPGARLGYWGAAPQSLSFLGDRLTVFTAAAVSAGRHSVCVTDVDSYDRLDTIMATSAPAAICTTGIVKPDIRRGFQADIHVHSEYSQDSTCPVLEIGRAALEKGLDLVCITDHCDIHPGHDEQALLACRKQAVAGIRKSAGAVGKPQVLVGVELGGGFFEPEIAARMVSAERYDVVIGSVHGILFRGERKSTSHFDFGSVDENAMYEYLDGYLDSALYVAEKLDVDILAHLTYILRYMNGTYHRNVDWRIREGKIRRILAAIISRGIPLEINTSCRGGAYDEWLPAREVVELYLEMGGYLFTLGSDAHVSKRIGSYFDEVRDYLRSKGVRYLMYFQDRIPCQYSI